jgi:hypothetical protein
VPRLLALLAIVGLAAHLRFSGLAWGHRHPMHTDEQLFVENVVAMLDAGDLDHRFYRYPGLFMYLLAAGIAPLGPEARHTNDAYIAARGVVATFGVIHVAVLCYVVSRLVGEKAGLVAALMAAVSPVDVTTSHQVRPDVVMEVLGMLAILALRRLGPSLRGDVVAGLAIGLASAVKYTGLLLVPSYVLARLLAPGPRLRGMLVAGAVTIAVIIACTPYALLHAREYRAGPAFHFHQYYPGPLARAMVTDHVGYFLRGGVRALGPLGAVALVAGAVILLRRSWRAWTPALLYPVTTVVVMATGSIVFPRYLLPSMGVVYMAAAVPFELLARTAPGSVLAALLTTATVAPLLRSSSDYVYLAAHESANDKVLDWILANVDRGARILETRAEANPGGTPGLMLGLPPGRYELVLRNQQAVDDLLPLIAPRMDLVIMEPGMGWGALKTVYAAENAVGVREVVLKAPARRLEEDLVDLRAAALRTSDGRHDPRAMVDGDPTTAWSTAGPLRGDEWIEATFPRPLRVARVELVTRRVPVDHDPELSVMADDGSGFQPVASVSARPPLREQATGRPLSQELMLKPRPVRAVRILQTGRRAQPWDVAELRIAARRRPEEAAP